MEARTARVVLRVALIAGTIASLGASYRTRNFVVSAPTQPLAESIGRAAEQYRRELAVAWLGRELPPWPSPCPIVAHVADGLGAGGATSFVFEHGEVGGWQMTIQGSAERILDSVLPHEVTHTVFATHFRQPLPRWADEGACTTVEATSERARHQQMLISFLRTGRGIAMTRLFAMKDYPPDILPLYAQGYSVARYLIEQGGRRKFVDFVADGLEDENWPRAMRKFYGDDSLAALQNRWLAWVREGSPRLVPQPDQPGRAPVTLVASHEPRQRPSPNLIYRVGRDDSQQAAPLVPVHGTESPLAASGWHAAGPREPAAARPDALNPPPAPMARPYQAVRQPPPQRPGQNVLE